MRTSQYLLSTLKEISSDIESISYQLMIRSGMIRKLTSGLYTWLFIGLKVLKKFENIIREEMNKSGAIEISMPMLQPISFWKKSGRWKECKNELFKIIDRKNNIFVLSPTHEEVITNLINNEINSYKQLPINFYQIQNKFRDEIRPRAGVIRSREFLMKDSYSFHIDIDSLNKTYALMHQVYSTIFKRVSLNFHIVEADSGFIGGTVSHEFHVINENKKKNIKSPNFRNISNIKLAETTSLVKKKKKNKENMRIIKVNQDCTYLELIKKFSLPLKKTIQLFVVKTNKNVYPSQFVALVIRGDHEISKNKIKKLSQVYFPLTFATEKEIYSIIGSHSYTIGPINLPIPLLIDNSVARMSNFITGSNTNGKYFFGVNWKRDLPLPKIVDIKKITNEDLVLNKEILSIKNSIEIGHTFQLHTKYSDIMKATVYGKDGKKIKLIMGCYGIGITRAIAAIIEQNHDKKGIIWPESLAPFSIAILPINMQKSYLVKKIAEKIYKKLLSYNIDVLIDDRKESPGVMFSDIELIGIPHIIIISEKNLNIKKIEYKKRSNQEKKMIKVDKIVDFLLKIVKINI